MSDYVHNVLHQTAVDQLYDLDPRLLYSVQVEGDLNTASVSGRLVEMQRVEDLEPKEETQDKVHLPPSSQPNIIAVLYLGPAELSERWEFKPISINNHRNTAVLINLRRLSPSISNSLLARLCTSERFVAVRSDKKSYKALRHLLRLALYVEGEELTASPRE
jgi:hypothetical protein